ncbi:DUF1761 domain-containing protein [Candidatus Pacearchaeota archaeon]|nr:DUF1761 domain-containing protein [Candidatus Pacearchaeota archaeon]
MVLGESVNLWAVLVSAIAAMIVGSLWYGPLFGKAWMKLSGMTPQKMKSMKTSVTRSYLLAFIGALVLAYVLGVIIGWANVTTLWSGVVVGFCVWLGFSATHALGAVIWEGKPWTAFWLNGLGGLVSLVIQGAILAAW